VGNVCARNFLAYTLSLRFTGVPRSERISSRADVLPHYCHYWLLLAWHRCGVPGILKFDCKQLISLCKHVATWYGLFMHLYDSNHEITQMQQDEKRITSKRRNELRADENIKIWKTSGLANICVLTYLNHKGLAKNLVGQLLSRPWKTFHVCRDWGCRFSQRSLLVEGSTWLLQDHRSVSQLSSLMSRSCQAKARRIKRLSPICPLITLQ